MGHKYKSPEFGKPSYTGSARLSLVKYSICSYRNVSKVIFMVGSTSLKVTIFGEAVVYSGNVAASPPFGSRVAAKRMR